MFGVVFGCGWFYFWIWGDSLNSVHELISTYGMEAMPQAMEILFNEAMLIERAQSTWCWALSAQ
jgi:hypothetical protein